MTVSESQQLLLTLITAPLVGSIATYFVSLKSQKLSPYIATFAAFISAFASLLLFRGLPGAVTELNLWNWIELFGQTISFSFVFDNLSAVMCLVITWIGSLIHLYSISYMNEEPSKGRYFCYLNLFLFSMLVLVLAANLPVMFIGWEGVGLCSYLLIGFWFSKNSYAIAGQKAFVVNRIGDVGFLIAMLILATSGVSLNFQSLANEIPLISDHVIALVAISLFLAAAGKSAQLPLFVWLPDAMAGPTPVSALIHAATMVTAGVYLFARTHVVLDAAPVVQMFILGMGTLTAFIGATSALAQRDIKKVLAYSTVSQLGFMFIAVGVGAYSAAIFHVVTHAFFKALLFLAAGSVIHGCHHEQLMENFGGLWKKMPVTFLTYLIGVLAISGAPFFSGAVSKDYILERVITAVNFSSSLPGTPLKLTEICWSIAVISAGITALYMVKSLILTFFGTYRGKHHEGQAAAEPHESPILMTSVLVILAIPSVLFGTMYGEKLLDFLKDYRGVLVIHNEAMHHSNELIIELFAGFGALIAVLIFGLPALSRMFNGQFKSLAPFFENAWRIDQLYNFVIVSPISRFGLFLQRVFDKQIVSGVTNGLGAVIEATGELTRRTHTGRISQFLPTMFISFGILVTFLLLIR
jgi:NADH-quinone oxidoreductase subunit L